MTTAETGHIAFTPSARAYQEKRGSRAGYARLEEKGGFKKTVTPDLAAFIVERDSFYLGTVSADGQPYIQHRGGRKGFLKVVDESTLAFADFRGNKQYITAGNLLDNDRAFVFLMDYAHRQRIKIWGRARVVEDDPDLIAQLMDAGYDGAPEQAIVFEIAQWDANCPQHITPRYTEDEVAEATDGLRRRIVELENEVAALKQ